MRNFIHLLNAFFVYLTAILFEFSILKFIFFNPSDGFNYIKNTLPIV